MFGTDRGRVVTLKLVTIRAQQMGGRLWPGKGHPIGIGSPKAPRVRRRVLFWLYNICTIFIYIYILYVIGMYIYSCMYNIIIVHYIYMYVYYVQNLVAILY